MRVLPPSFLALALALAAAPGRGTASEARVAESDPGLPLIQSFGVRDYDEHAQNWSVIQDRAGVLYFGNNNGTVLAYDGHAWRSFKVGGTAVRGLVFDEHERLYFGSVGDVGYLDDDGRGGRTYTSLRDQVPPEARDLVMYHVVGRPDGIFFFTRDHVLRWHEGKFTVETIRMAWPSQPGGRLLRHAADRPLEEWRDGAWRTLADLPELRRFIMRFATVLPDGALLLATNRGGFFRFADGRLTPWTSEIDPMTKAAGIERGLQLRDGGIVLSHRPQGFSIIENTGRFRHYFSEDNSSLVSSIAWAFWQDRQDDLWVMLDVGLARIDRPGALTVFGQTSDVRRANLHVICPFQGRIFAGGADGLWRLRPAEPGAVPPRQAHFEKVPDIAGDVRMLYDTPDELLVGTTTGLLSYRSDITPPEQVLPGTQVQALWLSRQDPTFGLAGTLTGVMPLRRDTDGWKILPKLPGIERENRGFLLDGDGAVWVAAFDRGFFRLVGVPGTALADGQPIRVEAYPGGHGFATDKLQAIPRMMTYAGRVHFLDAGDAYRFDPAARRFVKVFNVAERFGVPGATVTQFRQDLAGNFYAFTRRADAAGWPAKGLQVFGLSPAGETWALPRRAVEFIGASPALQQFSRADGRAALFLTGSDGIVRLELPAGLQPPTPFRVLLRGATDAVGAALPLGAMAILPYAGRALELTAATDRPGDAHLRYQWRLDEEPWSAWDAAPRFGFARLAAGRHSLQVRARDSDGMVSTPVVFAVEVLPPWWFTWWAYGGYALAGIGGAIGVSRWRERQLRRRNEELEALVATRTAELREAKAAADSANQAKSGFLASMSHELRTPLNAILGFSQILRRASGLQPEHRQRLEVIGRNGEHLLQMINEVLDLSKIEAGRLTLLPRPTELSRLVHEIAENFAARAADKGLEFRREIARDLPAVVLADEVKLRQVLINLLGNALKFTESGSVTLTVKREQDPARSLPPAHCTFSVADTGIGIAAADLERIFEPFRQGFGAFVTQGTGLGLAISQRIVGLMGGTIRVESTPGGGSRFWFEVTLPATERVATPPLASVVTGYQGQRRRLLVVDDEQTNREVMRGLLEPLGFGIEECADGRACVTAFQRHAADAVLLDLRMPGELDGYATARALRALPGGGVPAIIAVSASVFEEDRHTALAAGCDAFVPKPFTEERLFSALGDCLDLKWVLQESAPDAALLNLPAATAEELRDLARRGDITLLRERLRALEAQLPDCRATLAHLDVLAAGFQLGRLRQELRAARSANSRPPL